MLGMLRWLRKCRWVFIQHVLQIMYLKRTKYFTDPDASESISLRFSLVSACLPWNKEATGLKVPSGQWNGTLMVEDIQSRLLRLGIWSPKTYHPNTEPQEVWLDVYRESLTAHVCDSHRDGNMSLLNTLRCNWHSHGKSPYFLVNTVKMAGFSRVYVRPKNPPFERLFKSTQFVSSKFHRLNMKKECTLGPAYRFTLDNEG